VRVGELPALILAGKVRPIELKEEPVTTVEEMVRLALPKLFGVTAIVPLFPITTFPNLRLYC
jgi:hypothetical protein